MKKKIYFLTGKAGGFKAMEPLLKKILLHKDFSLKVLITDQHLDNNFGSTYKSIFKNFNKKFLVKIQSNNKDGSAFNRTSSMATLLYKLSFFLKKNKPDFLMLYGDRMESLTGAISCLNFSIPLIHFQGGDLSGNIDEKIRHSITKLSDFHFVSNKESKARLIQMGENKKKIYNVGDSHIDSLKKVSIKNASYYFNKYKIKSEYKPIIIMLHPENVGKNINYKFALNTLKSLKNLPNKKICIYPCNDLGFLEIIKALKIYEGKNFQIFKNIPYDDFIGLLKNCSFFIGNSSSGIIESSYLQIPVINLGTRQNLRLKSSNIIDSSFDLKHIKKSILTVQSKYFLTNNVNNCKKLYGDGKAFIKVYKILKNIKNKKIILEKKFIQI